uniref:Uncharacterized protein n=1 Tax=Arundo donax TaxID=35708 RepID=A0A0A9BU24_ARUDO
MEASSGAGVARWRVALQTWRAARHWCPGRAPPRSCQSPGPPGRRSCSGASSQSSPVYPCSPLSSCL